MQAAAAVASLGAAAGLPDSNFMRDETQIGRRTERLYGLDDERFMHDLGVLPGQVGRANLDGK